MDRVDRCAEFDLDTWGFADVEAGTAAIIDWIETVGWEGPSVDTGRWLVSGHSNGGKFQDLWWSAGADHLQGQGTWYALTHRPEKIIGAAPVSGYSSIQGQ